MKRTSPSGPISAEAIIAVSTYSSWLSKLSVIDARQHAIEREAADQQQDSRSRSRRSPIMRRVSDPRPRRRLGGFTSSVDPPAPARAEAAPSFKPRRFFEAVAEAADGGDDVGAQLLADAGDEHLDRVRIAVEILIVDMLDQLGAADHLALVVHQIAEQLIFLRGQLHRLAGLA